MKYKNASFYFIVLIIIVIIIVIILNINFKIKNIYYSNLYEIIKLNYILYHIDKAGFIDLEENEVKNLINRTSDPLLIKYHRHMNHKYGKIIMTYIDFIKNYYILDVELSNSILNDSPKLFGPGLIKEKVFNRFMPLNVGISKCETNIKCPWKKLRKFNENILSTNQYNQFINCIVDIVNKNIKHPLLNNNDFKKIALNITNESLFGKYNNIKHLESFLQYYTVDNIKNLPFYKKYVEDIKKSLLNENKCNLMYYIKKYNETLTLEEIIDQLPHWFGPFTFMISYLIPGLLCLILNLDNIYNKLYKEINLDSFNIYSTDTYLHYCVIEHIRLFNTINANMQRTVNQDIEYRGISFKKGDQIFLLHSSILRDESKFYNPDSFIPERWHNLPSSDQHIVFGTGPQQCVSRNITPIYYKSIIYHLLKNYNYDKSKVTPKIKNKDLYFINPYEIKFSIKQE